jgi:hypothetical protein
VLASFDKLLPGSGTTLLLSHGSCNVAACFELSHIIAFNNLPLALYDPYVFWHLGILSDFFADAGSLESKPKFLIKTILQGRMGVFGFFMIEFAIIVFVEMLGQKVIFLRHKAISV